MREHQNFAQFYCISVTNFSSLWMYPLGNYMNKKNVFFTFLWLFLCLHAMYLEKSPVDFLREVFAVCPVPITRSETWTKTVDVLSIRWQSDMRCTQQYVVSLDRKLNADSSGVNAVVVYKHLWSLERILVGNALKPQNALKCLTYPPSKWSWILTLSNEVWG